MFEGMRGIATFLTAIFWIVAGIPSPAGAQSIEYDREFEALEQEADLLEAKARLVKKVVRLCCPSVVHIKAIKSEGTTVGRSRAVEETGAGLVFRHGDDDFVLTNRHVIRSAEMDRIHIYTINGVHANPTQVLTDPETDIAVLRLPPGDYLPARCAEGEVLEVGDSVVAIGSPFGLSHSVTYGIVSALGRRDLQLGDEGVKFQDFIQTDAAINPGNSGGPLINLKGRVVGINTAIASNSGGNDGIGFAIPIDMALGIARALVDQGRVARGYLGVSLDSSFTPDQAKRLGLATYFGARVSHVNPASPAEVAGLQVGDVILEFRGIAIENDSHLVTEVARSPLSQPMEMLVYREGRELSMEIVLSERDMSSGVRTSAAQP